MTWSYWIHIQYLAYPVIVASLALNIQLAGVEKFGVAILEGSLMMMWANKWS